MLARAAMTLALALPLALVDQAHKAAFETPLWGYHVRSGAWVALSLGVLATCFALVRVPSLAVAVAAGVTAGGVGGNVVSALSSDRGIQNPVLFEAGRYSVALNLADLFTLAGLGLLMGALISVTVQNRRRLLPPRAVVRELRRRSSR